nr:hypothetical protein [Tanacetum cinerariifolium]
MIGGVRERCSMKCRR